ARGRDRLRQTVLHGRGGARNREPGGAGRPRPAGLPLSPPRLQTSGGRSRPPTVDSASLAIRFDAAVIGAGPAGSAPATVLPAPAARARLPGRAPFPRPRAAGGSRPGGAPSSLARLGSPARAGPCVPARV